MAQVVSFACWAGPSHVSHLVRFPRGGIVDKRLGIGRLQHSRHGSGIASDAGGDKLLARVAGLGGCRWLGSSLRGWRLWPGSSLRSVSRWVRLRGRPAAHRGLAGLKGLGAVLKVIYPGMGQWWTVVQVPHVERGPNIIQLWRRFSRDKSIKIIKLEIRQWEAPAAPQPRCFSGPRCSLATPLAARP